MYDAHGSLERIQSADRFENGEKVEVDEKKVHHLAVVLYHRGQSANRVKYSLMSGKL